MVNAAFVQFVPQRSETTVRLEGSLPDWLEGELLRTAPAVLQMGAFRAEHWFDALGMLYAFDLTPSSVRYRQRLLDSKYAAKAKSGRAGMASFGTRIQRSFLRRVFQPIPKPTDNTNVNVLPIGADWVALTESSEQLRVDPRSLEVLGKVHYEDGLPHAMMMTAHPHFDFERGQVVNLGSMFGRTSEMIAFWYAPGSPERTEIGRIRLPELPYVHSFGLSRGAAVVIGQPLQCAAIRFLWSNRGFIDHFRYRPELGTRLYVWDRSTNQAPRTFETEPFFTFHTVNTFEDAGDLVLDLLAYPDPSIIAALRMDALAAGLPPFRPSLRRIRMRANGQTTIETLSETGFEFPIIDYRRIHGRRHRYVWGSTAMADGKDIVALDTASGAIRRFGMAEYRFGEPVFVGRPGAAEEGDGVLLSVGSTEHRSVLAVLDARTLEPRALGHLEIPIPLGFHGSFART